MFEILILQTRVLQTVSNQVGKNNSFNHALPSKKNGFKHPDLHGCNTAESEFKAAILSLMPKHFHVYRQKYFPSMLLVYVLQLASFLLCQGPFHISLTEMFPTELIST